MLKLHRGITIHFVSKRSVTSPPKYVNVISQFSHTLRNLRLKLHRKFILQGWVECKIYFAVCLMKFYVILLVKSREKLENNVYYLFPIRLPELYTEFEGSLQVVRENLREKNTYCRRVCKHTYSLNSTQLVANESWLNQFFFFC